jgi:hypothetical protein
MLCAVSAVSKLTTFGFHMDRKLAEAYESSGDWALNVVDWVLMGRCGVQKCCGGVDGWQWGG